MLLRSIAEKIRFVNEFFPSLEIKKRGRSYLFSSGKRSTVDAVVEGSPFIIFWRTTVLFLITKGEQVGLLAPLLEGKRPVLWYNRGLEVE